MNKDLTREEFKKLLAEYVGAVLHADWAGDFATVKEQKRAKAAEKAALAKLEKAVFE